MANLVFKYGVMRSGKSTHLLQNAFNYDSNDMGVLVVKPKIDTKGNDKVVSRIGVNRKADLLLNKDDNLFEIVKDNYQDVRCILIDEAQFLERPQVDQCMDIVTILDIPVICYGLRTDFQTNLFPGSERLLAIANSLEEMETICSCGNNAIFVGRYVNGEFQIEGSQVAIDGKDNVIYKSMCAKCYGKAKMKLLRNK